MNTQSLPSDAYTVYKQNVQKYFENISKTTPQYFQSMTDLQKECMQTCKTTIENVVSMQEDFAKKTGIAFGIPDTAMASVEDTNKQIVQTSAMGNQFVKITVDAAVQNIKTYNDNLNAFVDLNRNIIQSWSTPFTLKN